LPRVSFFIDGFNVYHSLNDPRNSNRIPKYRKFLWLDYSKFLARHLRKQDEIADIFYFSAYAHFRSQRSVRTHQLLVSAWEGTGITAMLVTNDTDLVPAIKMLKKIRPKKKIGVLFPLDRSSAELKQACDFAKYTNRKHLSQSQFPDPITLPSGYKFSKPPIWK
jgi:uncharacterized LabA/DUF88 family protein